MSASVIEPAKRWHPDCIACGFNPDGLNLRFELEGEDVVTRFTDRARYQGYPGLLHAGVIATLLDATMTNCLFARRIYAYTASLNVRYRRRYFISSKKQLDAEQALATVRAHWGIENRLHWVLDLAFREDDCRVRAGNAAENFAVLRHFAMNLLKKREEQGRRQGS